MQYESKQMFVKLILSCHSQFCCLFHPFQLFIILEIHRYLQFQSRWDEFDSIQRFSGLGKSFTWLATSGSKWRITSNKWWWMSSKISFLDNYFYRDGINITKSRSRSEFQMKNYFVKDEFQNTIDTTLMMYAPNSSFISCIILSLNCHQSE